MNISILIFLLLLSLTPVGFSMLLDFTLGHPGKDEINNKAIFYGYTFWLAKRRLIKEGLYYELEKGFLEDSKNFTDKIVKNNLYTNFRRSVVMNAKDFFTWEHAFGICIFCTGAWISLLFGVLLYIFGIINIYFIILVIIFSHLLLRKLN